MHTGTSLASAGVAGVEDRQFRLLVLAVLGSLALHALILLFLAGFRGFSQGRAVLPPLTARIVKPKPPPAPPKAEPPPPLPVVRPATRSAPAARAPEQAPVPAPVAAAPTPVLSVESSRAAAEPAFTVPAAPAQPAPRVDAQPSLATVSGPDPASVARFRLELMEVATRYKRYPRIAQDNNWEGRVELRIAFAESGAISSISVKKGAGRAVLDEQAQSMIRSAQPQLVIPPLLRGKAFVLEIPVEFFLKEER
jgi:TonB family protein